MKKSFILLFVSFLGSLFYFIGSIASFTFYLDGLVLFLLSLSVLFFLLLDIVKIKEPKEQIVRSPKLYYVTEKIRSAEKGYTASRYDIANLIVSLYALRMGGKVPDDYDSLNYWRKKLVNYLSNNKELSDLVEVDKDTSKQNDKPDANYVAKLDKLIEMVVAL